MRSKFMFLLLVMVPGWVMGADYHVSDKVTVFMHTGPSNQYRIKANVPSGTMLDVLDRDNGTGYIKVRLGGGSEGWIDGKYIEKGQSLSQRLPVLEKALARSRQLTEEQSESLSALETDLKHSNDKQAGSITEIAQLQNEVERLQLEIDAMDETNLMGWFIRGGAVALGGLIIGLIIPHLPKKRRRNNDWF